MLFEAIEKKNSAKQTQALYPQHQESPTKSSKPSRSSTEGCVVPPSEGWSCQLQRWRIWGWLWKHSQLGRGLEKCKLGLHKTLTHEKSRVLKVSAEEWAKLQAACCLKINRNWGMPGASENLALVQGFFLSSATTPGSHVHLSGGKYGPLLFQGKSVWAFQLHPLEKIP